MKRLVVVLLALIIVIAFAAPATQAQTGAGRADVKAPAVAGEFLVQFQPGLAAAERA